MCMAKIMLAIEPNDVTSYITHALYEKYVIVILHRKQAVTCDKSFSTLISQFSPPSPNLAPPIL